MLRQHPKYRSEVYVPIKKDAHSFEERQKDIWDDMHLRMEKRRHEWEHEVENMRQDFFQLKPSDTRRGSTENLLQTKNLDNIFYDTSKGGSKTFRVSFDVSKFSPEEINVTTNDQKLIVYAKHEEKGSKQNLSREFSRQIDIPKHVDPDKLECTLSTDGVLQIEAPVTAPEYRKIQDLAHGDEQPKSVPGLQTELRGKSSLASGFHNKSGFPNTSGLQIGSGFLAGGSLHSEGPLIERDGSRKLKMLVDIGNEFSPQELSIKTVDRKLHIHAKHEVKSAGRTSFREFNREFDLPNDVDPQRVTASLTDDGKLHIEAPLANLT